MTSEIMLMHRVQCGNATFDDHISLAQSLISRGWAGKMPTDWAIEAFSFATVLTETTNERGEDVMQDVSIKIKYDQDEIASVEIDGKCKISVSDSDGEQVYETTKAIFSSSDCRENSL
mgnify:FL=1|jgi:hypothetical protein